MYLGLDLGTTNVKAVVVDGRGKTLATASVPVRLIHLENDGVEQDIEEIWAATRSAIEQLRVKQSGLDVLAIGVSSQGGAMQILDGQDRPIGRVISWLDGRGRRFDERITLQLGEELARRTGHARSIMALGQLLRLRKESPGLLSPPCRIGFVGDIIVGRLCGRRAHDGTSLSCALLYNPQTMAADRLMLDSVGLGQEQLPELMSVREPAGGLKDEVARRVGLAPGIPVSPAVHDQYASALCVGATGDGDVMFGAGTAWVILAVAKELMRPMAGMGFVCTHVAEGMYGQIVSLLNGGSAINWAMNLAGNGPGDVDGVLEETPAGCEALRCWPFFAEGEARFEGLGLRHGPAHVLRAVVEGMCLELGRFLEMLEVRPKRLIMCGGASGSRLTPGIVADVTGMRVVCAEEAATSAIGAGIIARGLVEKSTRLSEIAGEMGVAVRPVMPGGNGQMYRGMLRDYVALLKEAK